MKTAALQVAGAVVEIGGTIPSTLNENHAEARCGMRLMRADGRGSVIVIGLTSKEVRSIAPAFLSDVVLAVKEGR